MKQVSGWAYPDADVHMASAMLADGTYQGAHLKKALSYVTDWTCALDAGAHVGTWTRMLSRRFARVLAFEPSSDTFEALDANVRAFGLDNVDLYRAALGAEAGTVSMALDPKELARQNTGGRYVQDGGEIPRITIDYLNLRSLGFLKLDVEGSEPLVLQGARLTLERCRPIVLYEDKAHWSRYGLPGDAVETILRKAHYGPIARAGRDAIWVPPRKGGA